ncbi:MAG: TOBE domain-containing protein, partial [Phycisphaerales bacterium]|nr:TOBE domain-containing protein [Phycisphaerales bacterium]
EIRRICKDHGLTGVYVTHDQEEALSMADRIALLRDGQIQQCGTPEGMYGRPESRFVAEFLGDTNLVSASICGQDEGGVSLDTWLGPLRSTCPPDDLPEAGNVTCSIRPEAFRAASGDQSRLGSGGRVGGRVIGRMFLGERCRLTVQCGDQDEAVIDVLEIGDAARRSAIGDTVSLEIAADDVVILAD